MQLAPNRAAPPPLFHLVSRGLSWHEPLSSASPARPSRDQSSQYVCFYKSVTGKKLQLFKFYQISLKICTYQKELPSWVPEIAMSLWETRPGLAAEHAEVIVCSPMDPHPVALMKGEVLTQAVTHSRSSLRQVTAAGGVGQCPQHLRQSLLLDPAAVYKRYSLHLSLVYPDAPEWGTFIPF